MDYIHVVGQWDLDTAFTFHSADTNTVSRRNSGKLSHSRCNWHGILYRHLHGLFSYAREIPNDASLILLQDVINNTRHCRLNVDYSDITFFLARCARLDWAISRSLFSSIFRFKCHGLQADNQVVTKRCWCVIGDRSKPLESLGIRIGRTIIEVCVQICTEISFLLVLV